MLLSAFISFKDQIIRTKLYNEHRMMSCKQILMSVEWKLWLGEKRSTFLNASYNASVIWVAVVERALLSCF